MICLRWPSLKLIRLRVRQLRFSIMRHIWPCNLEGHGPLPSKHPYCVCHAHCDVSILKTKTRKKGKYQLHTLGFTRNILGKQIIKILFLVIDIRVFVYVECIDSYIHNIHVNNARWWQSNIHRSGDILYNYFNQRSRYDSI